MAGQSSGDPRSSPGPSPRAAREHQNLKRVPGATGRRAALAPADDAFPAPEERQFPEEKVERLGLWQGDAVTGRFRSRSLSPPHPKC